MWEVLWPHGYFAQLWSEQSGFKPWLGALCCVLGQDTLLSQNLSPPRCINGYSGEFNARGNPAMNYHPIQGGVEQLLVTSCYRNRDKLRPGGSHGLHADLTFFILLK